VAFRAAVLATAVFWVALFVLDHTAWKVVLAGIDVTEYLLFLVIFFFGLLTVKG
jgi:hypothetical protein